MNFERYHNLHSIIMLKEFIRKWWRMELGFADARGTVLDWEKGNIVAPPNDFCRLSLFSAEGHRRCSQSIRVLNEKFRNARKMRGCQFHDCHLSFSILGAPMYIDNEYQGMLFVEGFRRQPLTSHDITMVKGKIAEINPGTTDLNRAIEQVPMLNGLELERLTDLLEFAVNEIAAYEADMARKEEHIQALSTELSERYKFENIVGKSGPMMEVFRLLEKVSNSESTVLINGESGTGKELVARAIHFNGPRKDKPFVVQNCSAFNDNLLESALFGHTKGSFTGAIRDQKGLFEVADGGTFFLDEIGDMSPTLQVKLLRVLQEGTFLPVGGNQGREVDVRVIAATHKDLSVLVKKGEFREDLFYRINVIRVLIPPLRERRDDLPILVSHFLKKHSKPSQKPRGLSPEAMEVFANYRWPGNIRELENEIERLLVLGSDFDLIPADIISQRIQKSHDWPATRTPTQSKTFVGKLADAVEALERELIQQGLSRTRNNKSRLSKELGISRSNLIMKIAKYGLEQPGMENNDSDEASVI